MRVLTLLYECSDPDIAAANSFWDGGTESTAKAVGISGDSVHPDEIYSGSIDVTDSTVESA